MACPDSEKPQVVSAASRSTAIPTWAPRFTLIRTQKAAALRGFPGSPTIVIDGLDGVPEAAATIDMARFIYRSGPRTAYIRTKELRRVAIFRRAR